MMEIIDLRYSAKEVFLEKLKNRNKKEDEKIGSAVDEILNRVRRYGDQAVLEYTQKFDGISLTKETLKVTAEEVEEAYRVMDDKLLSVIRKAKRNIEDFHARQKEKSWFSAEKEGVILGQLYTPIERVGVYVPGGTAPLPSSVLMNVIPAKVAGVEKVIMATPPGKDGKVHAAILVAACETGVDEIYKIGGAQAIAALAFGTETVPKVDKIVGPGNIFVATAKKKVFGECDIDMIAGPSEIVVVADETANASYVAADLLSQAEHDVLASSLCITVSEALARSVQSEVERQLATLERNIIAQKSIDSYGTIVIVGSLKDACDLANGIAPEHLELCVKEPFTLLGSIKNAGAVFLGHYAPEPLGDYFAGPNHVLPTHGTARFFSPLNVGDFVKKTSVISYTREALEEVREDVILFAEAEGLTAHANAIKVRFDKG